MSIIFKCNNPNCDKHPCFVECKSAFTPGEYGDDSIEPPDTCPYLMETDEEAQFKFIPHGYTPNFDSLDALEDWFGEHYEDLPEDFINAVENCQFYGERARTDYRTVCVVSGLMKSDDRDSYCCQNKVDEVCAKFKKHEIFIAALYNGYRIGLLQGARLMAEGKKKDNNEEEY